MDNRISLMKDSIVSLSNKQNQYVFTIVEEIARGSSIIAYKAFNEIFGTVILKEYYPIDMDLIREQDRLVCEDEEEFEEAKMKFIDKISHFIYSIQMNLYDSTIYNNLPKTMIYEKENSCNNTLYMIQSYAYGCIYKEYEEKTLYELFKNILSITRIVSDLHKKDYIVFDMKPSNLFMIQASDQNFFHLIDFDSITQKNDIYHVEIKSTNQYCDLDITMDIVDQRFDLYSIGCILLEKLNKNSYDFSCVHSKVKPLVDQLLKHTLCKQENRIHDQEFIVKIEEILEYLQIQYFLKPMQFHKQSFFGYEDELFELHQLLKQQPLVCVSGMNGIGKKTLTYEYAYRHQNDYENIQMLSFENNWSDTLKQLNFNQPIEDQDILSFAFSIFNQLNHVLLIIHDYVSNKENDQILEYLLKTNVSILYTSTSFECDLRLYGLDENSAYLLFESIYNRPIKNNEKDVIYDFLMKVDYNPAMIQLFAKGASQTNVGYFKSPIKTFIQNIHSKKLLNYQNKIECIDLHIQEILKLQNFNDSLKELFNLFYFSDDSGLYEHFLVDYGINEKDILFLEQQYIVSRSNGKVKMNGLFRKDIILKALDIDTFVSNRLYDFLLKNDYPNLKLSILVKVSIVDPLYSSLFSSFISHDTCLDGDITLLKEVIDVIDQSNMYLNNSSELLKVASQVLHLREGLMNDWIDQIEKTLKNETSFYQFKQLQEASRLKYQAKRYKENGNISSAFECLLKANLIYQNYDLGYIDIIENYLTMSDYCNAMNLEDKYIFYAQKAVDTLKQSDLKENQRLNYRCHFALLKTKSSCDAWFEGIDEIIATYSYASNIDEKIHVLNEIAHLLTIQMYRNKHQYVIDDKAYDVILKSLNAYEKMCLEKDSSASMQFDILCTYAFYMYICWRRDEAHDMILQAYRKANQEHVHIRIHSYTHLTYLLSQMVSHNYHHSFTVSEIVQVIRNHHEYLNQGVKFDSSMIRVEAYYNLGILFAYISLCDQKYNQGSFREVGLSYLKNALILLKKSGGYPYEIAKLEGFIQYYGEKFILLHPNEDLMDYSYQEYQIENMKQLNHFLDVVLKEFV